MFWACKKVSFENEVSELTFIAAPRFINLKRGKAMKKQKHLLEQKKENNKHELLIALTNFKIASIQKSTEKIKLKSSIINLSNSIVSFWKVISILLFLTLSLLKYDTIISVIHLLGLK